MKSNYGLLVVTNSKSGNPDTVDIIHVCMYETEPKEIHIAGLVEELKTDPDFGLTDMVFEQDYIIWPVSGEHWEDLKRELKLPDEF